MARNKTTKERGKYKEYITKALFQDENIRTLLLGDISKLSANDMRVYFKDHVKSHLFIEDTIEQTGSFIFYDVRMPSLGAQIKSCYIIMYAICHRDILDDFSDPEYPGNRADALSQMIENCLLNDSELANKFGIGELRLDSVDIYNSNHFYGCVMEFEVPNFR